MTNENDFSIENLEERSRNFLYGILNHYSGTAENKLERCKKFLDEIIFQTKFDTNPFSNENRDLYYVAYYSRNILVPELSKKLIKLRETEPFSIHEWN